MKQDLKSGNACHLSSYTLTSLAAMNTMATTLKIISDFTNSFFPKISAKWNNLPFETRKKNLDDFKQDHIFRFKPPKYKVSS